MNLTRKEFKMVKKMQKIIDFAFEYKYCNYRRLHKHNGKRKLGVNDINKSDTIIYFGNERIVLIKNGKQPDSLTINIRGEIFELRDYDDDELFNLRTLYSNDDITALKVYCKLNFHNRPVGFYTMNYQLICDAAASIDNQFKKYDRSSFEYS